LFPLALFLSLSIAVPRYLSLSVSLSLSFSWCLSLPVLLWLSSVCCIGVKNSQKHLWYTWKNMDTDPNIKTNIKYTDRDKYMSTQTLDLQRTHMGNFWHLIHKHHKTHSHSRTNTHEQYAHA
jgi:hypothetical protein